MPSPSRSTRSSTAWCRRPMAAWAAERAAVGVGLVAAAGGAGAAYVLSIASFHVLSLAAMVLAVTVGVGAVLLRHRVERIH